MKRYQKSAELATKVSKLLPKIGNIVADDVPVSDDEDKDNKVVSTFGPTPTGDQYMHHHEVSDKSATNAAAGCRPISDTCPHDSRKRGCPSWDRGHGMRHVRVGARSFAPPGSACLEETSMAVVTSNLHGFLRLGEDNNANAFALSSGSSDMGQSLTYKFGVSVACVPVKCHPEREAIRRVL